MGKMNIVDARWLLRMYGRGLVLRPIDHVNLCFVVVRRRLFMFGFLLVPRRGEVLVPNLHDDRADPVRGRCRELVYTLRCQFFGKLCVVLVYLSEVGLQFRAFHERLVIAEEQRDDAFVEIVARHEYHAERQVVGSPIPGRGRGVTPEEPAAGNLHGGVREGGDFWQATVDLNGHEAGNGGYSQGKPTACQKVSSTRREGGIRTLGSKHKLPSMQSPENKIEAMQIEFVDREGV